MIKRKFVFAHMNVATEYAKLSSCQRLKVGALLVKDGTPVAIGYNGTKPGQDNCCEGADGKTLPTVRHAEINALNKLWTTNEKAAGSALFVTHAPCKECAIDLINAGVNEFYFRWAYRDDAGVRFLLENGAQVFKVLPDIDTIHRLSLRYNWSAQHEIAYAKVDEANEEAARVAESVGPDTHEIREDGSFFRKIQDNWLAGAEIHAGNGGYKEVPIDQYVRNPDWDRILSQAPEVPVVETDTNEGFIPFGKGISESGLAWPKPAKDRQSGATNKKPWNGPGRNNPVRPKP